MTDTTLTAVWERLYPDDLFGDARARIADERERIDRFLEQAPTPAVYGFTTLLGHLDDESATGDAQAHLLRAHLVGSARLAPAEWGQLLLRTKAAQLSHGGTGVSVEAFDTLRAALGDSAEWRGAWTASYGSGDVVPGAWFVEHLRKNHGLDVTRSGDLIALMNGHFVSTAAGIVAAARFVETTAAARRLVDQAAIGAGSGVQRPVTLRDTSRIHEHVDRVSRELADSLLSRVCAPSGNPLFVVDDDVRPESQSSFLDFRVTAALTAATQAVAQLGAYVKTAIAYPVRDEHGVDAPVQPTKIAQSLLAEMALQALPVDFAITESEGVEDVGDLSLQSARLLLRSTGLLNEMLALSDRAPVPTVLPDDLSSTASACEALLR